MNKNSAIIIAVVCLGVTLVLVVIAYDWLTYFYGFGNGTPLGQVQATASEGSGPGSKQVTLEWDLVSGAGSYNLYWADHKGVTKENGNRIQGVMPPYTFDKLEEGSSYYFVVTAVRGGIESAASNEVSYPAED